MACARVPHPDKPGARLQEVQTYSTMTRLLLRPADHLVGLRVSRVVMEATSNYWQPVFYLWLPTIHANRLPDRLRSDQRPGNPHLFQPVKGVRVRGAAVPFRLSVTGRRAGGGGPSGAPR